jgi:transposase
MRKIREILRLRWECKLSYRAIARSCAIGTSSAHECVRRAEQAGLSWPLPEELDDEALDQRLYPEEARPPGSTRPLPDWSYVHTELRKKSVTLRLLWLEYREAHPDGYGYSQFCQRYARWSGHLQPIMRLVHKAGEKCFIDYAGQTIEVVDPDTGEIHDAQLFVAALGASSYTYAEAQWSQELPNWVDGHVRAMAYFGGTTEIWTCDNLKAGVAKPCRYEPELNPTYHDLACHYDVAVVPARSGKPRDKAKVEVAVQVAERWILARLRKMQFFGLAALNQAIRGLLDELNREPMAQLGKSRHELFEALDRPALKPLPPTPYELATFKKAKVGVDYHVGFDHNFYSVPYRLCGQVAWIRATQRTVELFVQSQRVASHRRAFTTAKYYTLDEHRPPAHKKYLEWTPERFLRWARQIGPATAQLIDARLNAKQHPEQSYRACLGILGLAKRYTEPRLEAACRRALGSGIHSYQGLKNILESRYDQLPLELAEPKTPPAHPHLRGKTYYR